MVKKSYERVFVYGKALDTKAYEIRDFLQRSVVDFEWLEIKDEQDCRKHLGLSLNEVKLPVVELPDGRRLFAPSLREVGECLGWVKQPRLQEYDLSIYGAGPAGLSAAMYAASEGLRTALVERYAIGGQAGSSSLIENYLGFPKGICGAELAERARQQAVKFGVDMLALREGVRGEFRENRIYADLADGSTLVAHANICATGVEYRRLGVAEEQKFLDKGVFYGAGAAEAPFCKDKIVYVVGGANSAGQAVLHFAAYAAKVVMIVRANNFADTMSKYLADRILKQPNVEVRFNSTLKKLDGDDSLREITILNHTTQQEQTLAASHLFICIGGKPNTEWAKDLLIRDEADYLVTGPDLIKEGKKPSCWTLKRDPFFLETSVPGSFAAGDVRHGSVKRVAAAVGEGAMAVTFVHRYLKETWNS